MTSHDDLMAAMLAREERLRPISDRLLAADPTLGISAYIIAGDMLSAEDAEERIKAGSDPWREIHAGVGSYARLDFAVRQLEAGRISRRRLYRELPALWRGSDPDDTDPRFLDLWRRAWQANLRRTILDGEPLPPADAQHRLTIYRGQDAPNRTAGRPSVGIAWSTDQAIANKFANGAAVRQAHRPGVILRARVDPAKVLAYLTGRNEAEAIVDPKDVEWTL